MGRAILGASEGRLQVIAGIVRPGTEERPWELDSLTKLDDEIDGIVDVSSPSASLEALKWAREHGVAFVSGTTGFSESQEAAFDAAASEIPVLLASNFSVGVQILSRLVELAARASGDWDIEVFEAHHRHKVDAPSGTALTLGESAARGRQLALEDSAKWSRHGAAGPRQDDEIGFQVLRGGSIVGEHTVYFCAEGERIELTHRATDRSIFARGAVRAAEWLIEQPAGRYSMADVLFGEA